jgi:hypothetical protein
MKLRRILTLTAACAAVSLAVSGTAQAAKKPPKAKDYTYCVTVPKEGGGTEHECFESEPFEVFKKTGSFKFGGTTGTYTQHGKEYVFKESETSENKGADELRGTRGKKRVISGTLYENGKATETAFTLTPAAHS